MADLERIDAPEASRRQAEGALLLDVREPEEWAAGRAPGVQHLPLGDLPLFARELDRDRPIVCVCRSGARSARAAQYLGELGHAVANLEGGMQAWAAAGLPLEGDGPQPLIA